MRLKPFCFLLVLITFCSCSEYNRVLKNPDIDLRYTFAKKYFNDGKYERATTLLEELVNSLTGTSRGEESLYLLAQSYYNTKRYDDATSMFVNYYSRYPKGEYAEPALFYSAYGMYLDSPDPRLDQSRTYKAIAQFQKYIEDYPQSERVQQSKEYLFELQEKLAYKELLSSKLYLKIGSYGSLQANNYDAAIVTATEAIKSYPYSKYLEDFEIVILRSRFELAENSIVEKRPERYRQVIDEYFNYKNMYPNGKYLNEADKYYKKAEKYIGKNGDA